MMKSRLPKYHLLILTVSILSIFSSQALAYEKASKSKEVGDCAVIGVEETDLGLNWINLNIEKLNSKVYIHAQAQVCMQSGTEGARNICVVEHHFAELNNADLKRRFENDEDINVSEFPELNFVGTTFNGPSVVTFSPKPEEAPTTVVYRSHDAQGTVEYPIQCTTL